MNLTSQSSSDRSAPQHQQTQQTQRPDNPGVRLPPPAIYVVAFLVSFLLQHWFPLPFLSRPVALGLGLALVTAGGLFIATAIPTMLRRHGTLNTAAASAALVMSGPYRYSRNPMYVGLILLYTGLALVFAMPWALPLLIPLVLYTSVGAIAPEERYLERAFGDDYRVYKTQVRRWL
jgi:protein-S-isoprenylcysteine O-methyltransferase Ste14